MADLSGELIGLLTSGGASMVGFADLCPLPAEVRAGFARGVSVAVALDPGVVCGLASGPTRAYYAEYARVNELLGALASAGASFLRDAGCAAEPLLPTAEDYDRATLSSPLPHKTVATLAGLGWIGKCALLVNDRYGSAVRLVSILTDAPLPAAAPVVASRCGDCRTCVDACPAGAPSGRPWEPGLPRESFYDAFACERTALRLSRRRGIPSTICGICVRSCPYTRRYLGASNP